MPRQAHSAESHVKRAGEAGAVPVEYALIAATVVFAILSALRVIGSETSLGFPPIINAFTKALS